MQGRPGLTILLLALGGILLLPGFCVVVTSIGLAAGGAMGWLDLPIFVLLWIVCGLIAWGGVLLIRKALR